MSRPEDLFQQAAHAYLATVLPADAYHTFVDKAGKRSAIQGAMLAKRGIKSGFPDGHIVWQGRAYYIECKSAVGKLNDNQKIEFPKITAAGGKISVCRTVAEVYRALVHWGIPLEHTNLHPEVRDQMWQARLTKKPARPSKPRAAKPTRAQVARGNRLSLVGVVR